MKEWISVIVPIYNVEDYLPKCIDSIISQTYRDLEIILVDDGSTDNCSKICDEYKKKDIRIKVIHKENGGLPSARNTGLDIANGSLIGFVDSDDYIEPTMYEKLYDNMKKNHSDISICNYYKVNNNRKKIMVKEIELKEFCSVGRDKFTNIHSKYATLMSIAWNKLYKKEIFNDIRYPDGQIYEDSYIICNLLEKAKKISFILEPLYYYVYRKNSIINSFSIKQFDIMKSFNKKIEVFNEKGYIDLVTKEKNKKSKVIIINLSKMLINKINDEKTYNKYYNELINTTKEIKWKESSKEVKRFKVFKSYYVTWNYIERNTYKYIKYFINK